MSTVVEGVVELSATDVTSMFVVCAIGGDEQATTRLATTPPTSLRLFVSIN
ncbi:MAG TPA: hypothetical protein VIA81_10175 [Acidimicrobiia bacterium]